MNGDDPTGTNTDLEDGLEDAQSELPLALGIRAMVERLVKEELLVVDEHFSPQQACDVVLNTLERFNKRGPRRTIEAIAEALTDVRGVEELFADDDTLEERLRETLAKL